MNGLSLTKKLLLLLVLPLVGIIAFGTHGAWQKWKTWKEFEHLEDVTVVVEQMGSLIHELQKERGRSATFINSQGSLYAKELSTQQEKTSEEFTELQEVLKGFDTASEGERFRNGVDHALDALETLSNQRDAIQNFAVSSAESSAYYTEIVISLLNAMDSLSRELSNAKIATGIQTYISLLWYKEYNGRERAILSATFEANAFKGKSFLEFSKVVAAQEIYLSSFTQLANPAQLAYFNQKVSGSAVEASASMRQIALSRAEQGNFQVQPGEWWDAISTKIDLLKEVEDRFATDYKEGAHRIGSGSRHALCIYALVTLAIITLASAMGTRTVRSISGPLKRIINSLDRAAEQTATAAVQISSTSHTLASGATQQAASLEETAASLEEISSMTKRNADHANKANDLSVQTHRAADESIVDVKAMSEAMDEIRASSTEVAKIAKDIDEIAFQTNILALNAAVEAARAGEAGAGFAVVADEVRNLAQRSALSARETALKIEDALTKSDRGNQISQKVASAFQDIVAKTREVKECVSEIAGTTREQAEGINQVNVAVSQMDRLTQSNAAAAEESASAARELTRQAKTLTGSFQSLRQLVGGTATDLNRISHPNNLSGSKSGKTQSNSTRQKKQDAAEPVLLHSRF